MKVNLLEGNSNTLKMTLKISSLKNFITQITKNELFTR